MVKSAISLITILSLAVCQSSLLFARQAAPSRAGASTATADQPVDGGWPRGYATPAGAQLILYQPQVASWANQKRLTMYSAVSYHGKGAKAASLGTLKVESDTSVAVAERLVNFSEFSVTEANFPTLPKEQLKGVIADILDAVPREQRVIALDRVLAGVDASMIVPRNVPGVKADPPAVFFSTKPSALVNFDGDPIWSPIESNDLRFAVNTNWDVFEHGPTKTYFLRVNDSWMTAAAVKGPWTPVGKLPPSFGKLPANENWKEVKSALPGKTLTATQAPVVFISMTPAEMILTTGEPAYTPVTGTRLLWVNNTESDVFRDGQTGPFYFLVSGRWFAAPALGGPWKFATLSLPDDFKRIPLEHPRSRVLASVPGTSQAIDAVLLAQIPQTAAVNRKAIMAPEVSYQGAPEFVPIEQTTVSRAVNTDKDILKVGDLYYMCFQGVWFMSKAATGPWEVASSIPKQIYEIPVSSPVHNVTYVTVESSTRRYCHLRRRRRLHGSDGRVRLRSLGKWLVLSALHRLRRDVSRLLPVLPHLWIRRLVQPMDRRILRGARRSTARTAEPVWARGTTREPARIREGRLRMARTAQRVRRRRITLEQVRLRARVRAQTRTGAGERLPFNAAISGRRLRASPTTGREPRVV